jgi:hypothetical protein
VKPVVKKDFKRRASRIAIEVKLDVGTPRTAAVRKVDGDALPETNEARK